MSDVNKLLNPIFFFCLLSSSFTFGLEQACVGTKLINIVIIADAFTEESASRNFQLKETMQKRTGEWRYIRVRSEQDIQNALRLNPGECIKTMIVQGLHTRWENGNLKASVRYGEGSRLVYKPIDFDLAFSSDCPKVSMIGTMMGISYSKLTGGGPNTGCDSNNSKFAESSLIAFDSCNLAPEDNPDLIFKRLKSVLKLKKSSVYANYTYGVLHPSNLLAVPCYEGSQGGLVKSMRTLFQALWPLTLAVNSSLYAMQNKGYLASINGNEIIYSSSKFQDAIKTSQ